jgi:superfamily II DNA or RNA helicase
MPDTTTTNGLELEPDVPALFAIPRRFELQERIHGSWLRRLAFDDHERRFAITTFQHGRTSGYIGTDESGNRTFLSPRHTIATAGCDEVLHVPDVASEADIRSSLSDGIARWLMPLVRRTADQPLNVAEATCRSIVETWKGKFQFREERKEADGTVTPGLRRPQIGAVHAILAQWSVDHKATTIVMPTGTGKTETMLAILVQAQLSRLLVIVPNSALRDQLSEKFLALGVLVQSGCVDASARLPAVASLHRRPTSVEEVDEIFRRANVIVSTMQVAGQCAPEVQARMAALCSHLFIDEAHHIAARTWYEFKQQFVDKPIVQFTATPFRTDGKRIDGKFIYTYPLAKAQAEGYFQKINFIAVSEFDQADADAAIAQTAGVRLKNDLEAGFDHVLMARVDSIARATTILETYQGELPEFHPVLIHSQTNATERAELLRRVHARESRVIVCVDMFGEGFDFPELKVAALHDRHKSLAITLQFIGRFTRTKSSLGEASVIANVADDSITGALRNLYAEDADWNFLLKVLSHGATDRAHKRAEVLAGFVGELPDIPLQTLFPRMSAVVYRTECEQWDPLRVEDVIQGTRLHAGPIINPEKNLAIFVTRDEELVRWGAIKQIQNVMWNLYVLHWDERQKLLFINSSTKDFHEHIAEAVSGSKDRISGDSVFRSLGKIKRLTLTNLGLSHAFGKNIRYTMFMGADIAEGLSEAQRLNKRKSNLFGLGYEDDEKVTMGCSFKGRFWSYKIAYDLAEWVDWCQHVGEKLRDSAIQTDQIFSNVIQAKRVTERPALVPVMVAWPEGFQDQPEEVIEIEMGALKAVFYETEMDVETHQSDGPLQFSVRVGSSKAVFNIEISEHGARYDQVSGATASARIRGATKRLSEWFSVDPPIVHFANGDFLVLNELFELPRGADRRSFNVDQIHVWDWAGVNIRKESQGPEKDATSIQKRVIDRILDASLGEFDIVFDDDGSGEVADVVAIKQSEKRILVDLFHCKYSSAERPGSRIDDLYVLCGQAQKCVRWREDPPKLLKRLLYREGLRTNAGGPSRFEKGTKQELQRLANAAKDFGFDYRVHIVQPGFSKAGVAGPHSDLLGATESFLQETYSMSLDVIASA